MKRDYVLLQKVTARLNLAARAMGRYVTKFADYIGADDLCFTQPVG